MDITDVRFFIKSLTSVFLCIKFDFWRWKMLKIGEKKSKKEINIVIYRQIKEKNIKKLKKYENNVYINWKNIKYIV